MRTQEKNRNKWLHVRLNQDEYNEIRAQYAKSTCRAISEFSRTKILGKPLTVNYRNASTEQLVSEIILLRLELSAIGNNFNQAVRRLHTLRDSEEVKMWAVVNEQHKQKLFGKMREVNEKLHQIHAQWSSR